MKKLIYTIIFVIGLASHVEAKNLYVNNSGSPTCSDTTNTYATNTASAPWCTLGRALWGNANRSTPTAGQAATAGDTVLVSAGTYTAPDSQGAAHPSARWMVAFNPVNSGTSEEARITIRAVGTVNLRSTGTDGGPIIGSNGKNYITWDGFTVDETTYAQLDAGEQGNAVVVSANYVNITNCTLIGTTSTQADQNHHGIYYNSTNGGHIYNNTIRDVKGVDRNVEGILTYYANDLIIEHNNIYNSNSGIFLKVGNSDSVITRYNKIYDVTYTGILLGSATGEMTNHLIYQNLIYNAESGIKTNSAATTGNKIVNNTIYNVYWGLWYHNEPGTILWYNNIIHTASSGSVLNTSYPSIAPTIHEWEHNLYYNTAVQWDHDGADNQNWAYWTGTWGLDSVTPAGTSGSDPLFVTNGSNFKLQAGSPALTLGVDILDLDNDGQTNETIPAGAYITGNEKIGIESGLALPPPSTSGGGGGGCSVSPTGKSDEQSNMWIILALLAPTLVLVIRKLNNRR